jgi:DNA-binding CsgD family transcriptional regulator
MGQISELQEARRRLGLALSPICHDRWVIGYLRRGWLQPIAASEVSRRFLQSRPLMPLSRRSLFEKRPLVMNSLIEKANPSNGYDWELDWPAILYAPIGDPSQRPIGLLTLGCRRDHWYTDDDVAYAETLGLTLTPLVVALRRPLARLNESEGEVAQLLSYGLSTQEIAQAIKADETHTRSLVASVARKLQSVHTDDLMFPIVPMKRRAFRL